MTEMLVTESAAQAGAALLDERRPGWFREIDLGRLNIDSPCDCPLGQLYGANEATPLGSYWAGLRAVGIAFASEDAVRHGFAIRKDFHGLQEREQRYAELTNAWRAEILRRREQDDANPSVLTITTVTVTAAQHGVMNPDGTWTVEEWEAPDAEETEV